MSGETGDRGDARDEGERRRPWLPPLELLLAPALVIFLLHALTPRPALFPNQGDLLLYFQKAEALAAGGFPYRDFAFEYPPLAIVAMAVPFNAWLVGPPDFDVYRWLFTAWEAVLLIGLVLVGGRMADLVVGGRSSAGRAAVVRVVATRLLVLAVVMAPSLTFRFDLLPALIVAIGLLAVLEGRAGWAGVFFGLGVLVKVYPVVLVPVVAIAWLAPVDRLRIASFAAGFGATVSGGLLLFVLPFGDAAWSFLSYQVGRGLQLESVSASLLLVVSAIRGAEVPLAFEFGAVHVAGPGTDLLLALQPVVAVAGFIGLAALGLRRLRREAAIAGAARPRTLVVLAVAAIALFLVTNKVFSVQYVVWLLPLAALLSRGQFWLVAVIAVLSIGIHPVFYDGLIAQELPIVLLLCVRNALVGVLLAWVVVELARPGDEPADDGPVRWAGPMGVPA